MPATPRAAVGARHRAALALPLLVVLLAAAFPSRPAAAAQQPPLMGMLVTLSATAEEPGQERGLVIRITLDNQTGMDVHGLSVTAPVPPQARAAPLPGDLPGPPPAIGAQFVEWRDLTLRSGEQLGPFAYRLLPADGANGAVIFREASIQPHVTWTEPRAGEAVAGTLPLNGLWGDVDLRRTLLPSGLTVLTRERPDTETVALRVAVRAGARDEDDTTHGGSHWLEHGHFLGTTTRPTAQAVAATIDNVGGQQNAGTSFEWTDYWHLVPAPDFDLALEALADMLLNSTFPREAFDRERRVVFEEIRRAMDDPASRAGREFLKLVFEVSPLKRDVLGPIERVQSIPIETILAYRDERYVTGNMAVAAVGRLHHDEAVATIATAFADLPRGPRAERPPVPEPVQTAPRRLVIGDGNRVSEIRLGWPAPADTSADSPAMTIIEEILGDTGRRLTEEIRERRSLATFVAPGYAPFSDAGTFLVAARTQPDHEQQVIDLILAEIQRLRDGDVTEEEVRASVRALAGRRALAEETNLMQSARARVEVSGVLESFAETRARLSTVTAADVQRVAQTYLDPENYTLVIVRA